MRHSLNARLRALAFLLPLVALLPAATAARTVSGRGAEQPAPSGQIVKQLHYAGSRLVLSYAPAEFKLTEKDIADWVLRSARATATFFGRFPVAEVRILLQSARGEGVHDGEAWANPKPNIRIVIGRDTTRQDLFSESTMVHEMTHLAFPDLDDAHLWLHEGIATYVETVARAQAREIAPAEAWAHFIGEMPQGLPERGDHGIDATPSTDRRYWGGAMFCLMADIEIRRRTANRHGLKDALRAVLNAGGTLAATWTIERALDTGDKAVGVPVLRELYASWKDKSVAPDLERIWSQLGVSASGDRARLVETAPLAPIRRSITELPARPALLAGPVLLYEATRRP